MRKKIILKLKPTVQKNNRHFVIFEFKYHAINIRDNGDIGMYHAYLLRIYDSYLPLRVILVKTIKIKLR